METQRCKIKLNNQQNCYFAGETITGTFTLILQKKTKIKGIHFQVLGYSKCKWYDILGRDAQTKSFKDVSSSVYYSARIEHLNETRYIFGSKLSSPIELNEGEHPYEFRFGLLPILPSSFRGQYGSVKYKMIFTVDKIWSFNEKYCIPLIITRFNPLTQNMCLRPISQKETCNIGYFNSGPLIVEAELLNDSIVSGQSFTICVMVKNRSNTPVDKLRFVVKQIIIYNSLIPRPAKREEYVKIIEKEAGGVDKRTDRKFEHQINLPNCTPSDNNCQNIINISYEIKVQLILPGLHKNITLFLPVTVCSHIPNNNAQIYNQIPVAIGFTTNQIDNNSPSRNLINARLTFIELPNNLIQNQNNSTINSFDSNNMVSPGIRDLSIESNDNSFNYGNDINRQSFRLSTTRGGDSSAEITIRQEDLAPNYPEIQPPSYDDIFGKATAPALDVIE